MKQKTLRYSNTCKVLSVLLICTILTIYCCACRKLENTTTMTVIATVIDAKCEPGLTTYIMVGKVLVPQQHAPTYSLTLQYDGSNYELEGEDTYNLYKDKIGANVTATLVTDNFDDGTNTSYISKIIGEYVTLE